MKTRKLYPDVLRGFAAILVVLGHCIQECGGYEMWFCQYYWYSEHYQFIYSFHMPFFMLITGYFAGYGFIKAANISDKLRLFGKRAVSCLVPVFVMTGLDCIRLYFEAKAQGTGLPYSSVGDFFKMAYNSLWFLWAVVICYGVVLLVNILFRDNLIVYFLIYLSLFIIPDRYNFHVYKYIFPFFVLGYFYKRFEGKIRPVYEERKPFCLFVFSAIFAVLVCLFNDKMFIYKSGYVITNAVWYKMVAVDVYRLLVGLAGSLFFMMLLEQIFGGTINRLSNLDSAKEGKATKPGVAGVTVKVLAALGRESMGIYIIQGYIILMFLRKYADPYYYKAYIIVPFAIITIVVSYVILSLLRFIKEKLLSIVHIAKHEL